MQDSQEFYIGWQDEAPAGFAKQVRRFVLTLTLVAAAAAALVVIFQNGFATSTFELGKITELEGVLVKEPAPFLRIYRGRDALGKPVFQHILLVGKGKHGALQAMEKMGSGAAGLFGKPVKLKGSLIYHDGRTLLELSADPADIREVRQEETPPFPESESLKSGIFIGEFTDPKCLFGVMKPGFGKPHRSCAARCIAGGIPPVFKTVSSSGETQYYLLVGAEGEPVNDEILPYVADQAVICGEAKRFGDWLVLYKDSGKDIARIPRRFNAEMPMCH